MVRIDYLEDDDGNLTKVLLSDKRFVVHSRFSDEEDPDYFALTLTDEIEMAIKGE